MTTDEARLIRKAVPADLPRIHAIRMDVRENILRDPSKVTAEEVAWYREQAIFLVAEDAGEIVGFACANHQTGLIWALFVDPAQEGRGHGRALLDAALGGRFEGMPMAVHPVFGLRMPSACPEVDPGLLNPRSTWADTCAYDEVARGLAGRFEDNFARFAPYVGASVKAAAIRSAA